MPELQSMGKDYSDLSDMTSGDIGELINKFNASQDRLAAADTTGSFVAKKIKTDERAEFAKQCSLQKERRETTI